MASPDVSAAKHERACRVTAKLLSMMSLCSYGHPSPVAAQLFTSALYKKHRVSWHVRAPHWWS